MSVIHCDKCGGMVDTDYDAEHEEECDGTVIYDEDSWREDR